MLRCGARAASKRGCNLCGGLWSDSVKVRKPPWAAGCAAPRKTPAIPRSGGIGSGNGSGRDGEGGIGRRHESPASAAATGARVRLCRGAGSPAQAGLGAGANRQRPPRLRVRGRDSAGARDFRCGRDWARAGLRRGRDRRRTIDSRRGGAGEGVAAAAPGAKRAIRGRRARARRFGPAWSGTSPVAAGALTLRQGC